MYLCYNSGMAYAKRVNIIRRRLVVQGAEVEAELHKLAHQLAIDFKLSGFARYLDSHLHIEVEGKEAQILRFLSAFRGYVPEEVMATIDEIETIPLVGDGDFSIEG